MGCAWAVPGLCLAVPGSAWAVPGLCLGCAWGVPGLCLSVISRLHPIYRYRFDLSRRVVARKRTCDMSLVSVCLVGSAF